MLNACGVGMSPSEFAACYRLYAANCFAIAKRSVRYWSQGLSLYQGTSLTAVAGCLRLIIVIVLTCGLARAQDLDRGKSGAQLFAASCVTCHRSPSGLAKGRFSWTLSYFLQQHYTSNLAAAQTLTVYLQSVDVIRSKPQLAAQKRQATEENSVSEMPPRPPLPVPAR
jgi:mono/diheme cytochrome c family protein